MYIYIMSITLVSNLLFSLTFPHFLHFHLSISVCLSPFFSFLQYTYIYIACCLSHRCRGRRDWESEWDNWKPRHAPAQRQTAVPIERCALVHQAGRAGGTSECEQTLASRPSRQNGGKCRRWCTSQRLGKGSDRLGSTQTVLIDWC